MATTHKRTYANPPFANFLFADTRSAPFWLLVRLYIGWVWLQSGWGKINSEAWVGSDAGAALTGFLSGALEKTGGAHPDVQMWYAAFLENVVLENADTWSFVIAWGEFLVGVALILGLFTGIAAFFGLFMNLNFLLAGTVSTNPILFTLGIGVMLAWKVAGHIGVDYWLLPALGTPWKGDAGGKIFRRKK